MAGSALLFQGLLISTGWRGELLNQEISIKLEANHQTDKSILVLLRQTISTGISIDNIHTANQDKNNSECQTLTTMFTVTWALNKSLPDQFKIGSGYQYRHDHVKDRSFSFVFHDE